jgi:hypothetical protein
LQSGGILGTPNTIWLSGAYVPKASLVPTSCALLNVHACTVSFSLNVCNAA